MIRWTAGLPLCFRSAAIDFMITWPAGSLPLRLLSADLVVAMEDSHVRSVLKLAPDPSKVSLLTDFDPAAEPGSGVPDPYFGSDTGFYDTLAAIEAAMPGLLDRIRTLQSQ